MLVSKTVTMFASVMALLVSVLFTAGTTSAHAVPKSTPTLSVKMDTGVMSVSGERSKKKVNKKKPSKAEKKKATKKKLSKAAKKKKARLAREKKLLKVAKKQVGVRYRYGGSSPRVGFDCSGFTQYVYRKALGKKLPRSSSAQRNAGKRVNTPRPGDIVWTPGHVAIYVSKGKIIDAPKPGKRIKVRSMWQSSPVYIRP